MDKDGKKQPDNKKGFPGILLLFVIGLIVILAFQNLSGSGASSIAFSHQLEHLVNLDLVDPDMNKKRAGSSAGLVSFSGQFRDESTKRGEESFRYVSLLNANHDLKSTLASTKEELNALQEQSRALAKYYYQITDYSIPHNGLVIFPAVADLHDFNSAIILYDAPYAKAGQVTLRSLKKSIAELQEGKTSSELPIVQENFKQFLMEIRTNLGVSKQADKDRLQQILYDVNKGSVASLKSALSTTENFLRKIAKPVNNIRFHDLRPIWNYEEKVGLYATIWNEFEKNSLQLEKAQGQVKDQVWFYNGKELTTAQLAARPPEEFKHWYKKADKEWHDYGSANKGLAFMAHDQPVNSVLEKTFISEENSPSFLGHLITFLPLIIIFALLWMIFSRQMKGMGSNAMNFGKSPARQIQQTRKRVTFDDVAGVDEAKEELEEMVEFLKDPARFQNLGARIPKGLLLVGPPGTGKTLLARAVAGEAGAPFYSISGSDFVEMFVGVGASRVRDLFSEAKKNSPAIIFIDEIDAVGRHRGSGLGGGHDEREQTLNQLLVEMDGMDSSHEAVIVIAATNRPDVLDSALLRPGRFDRRVHVDLPPYLGRLEILKVHVKKVKLGANVDLKAIARRTQGKSGAELESIVNEAALIAAKRFGKAISHEDMLEATDKVLYGKERRSLKLDEEDKKITAYHEAGHAIIGLHLKSTDPVVYVTMIPKGQSLGATHFESKPNRVNFRYQELKVQLATLMGGRVAEEYLNQDPTSGASMDIKMATNYAKAMVMEWGMSEKLGMVNYSDENQGSLMAGFHEKPYSEETARTIDSEVSRILKEAYEEAQTILNEKKDTLEMMAQALLEFESLGRSDLDKIMDGIFSFDEKRKELADTEDDKTPTPPPLPPQVQTELKRRGRKDKGTDPKPHPI